MSEQTPGILAIWNDCAPGTEGDFEEWYQHEHLLERIAVPGFLVGRRYEAVSGTPRFFCCYLTESADVLTAAAYRERLANPTPLTRRMMSDTFHKTNRTVCQRTQHFGAMRGAAAVTLRFTGTVDQDALRQAAADLVKDKAVACADVWTAADVSKLPLSEEERLRGGDKKIEACLFAETLRIEDAEKIAGALAAQFSLADTGVYRLLCEIRSL